MKTANLTAAEQKIVDYVEGKNPPSVPNLAKSKVRYQAIATAQIAKSQGTHSSKPHTKSKKQG